MTVLLVGSIVLATFQVLSIWCLSRKNRFGWILSIIANLIGVVYDLLTGQYGFLPVCVISITMAVKAYIAWGKDNNATHQ